MQYKYQTQELRYCSLTTIAKAHYITHTYQPNTRISKSTNRLRYSSLTTAAVAKHTLHAYSVIQAHFVVFPNRPIDCDAVHPLPQRWQSTRCTPTVSTNRALALDSSLDFSPVFYACTRISSPQLTHVCDVCSASERTSSTWTYVGYTRIQMRLIHEITVAMCVLHTYRPSTGISKVINRALKHDSSLDFSSISGAYTRAHSLVAPWSSACASDVCSASGSSFSLSMALGGRSLFRFFWAHFERRQWAHGHALRSIAILPQHRFRKDLRQLQRPTKRHRDKNYEIVTPHSV